MKTRVRAFVLAVLTGGAVWGAWAQSAPISVTTGRIDLIASRMSVTGYSLLEMGGYSVELSGNNIFITPAHFTRHNGALNVYGDMVLTGNLNGVAPKSFIHPHPTDDSKVIRYIAIESAEALTVARGTAKTVNGEAVIKLPEHFSMVTCQNEPLTTIVTPKGAPVLLYVKQESREKIVVAMRKPDFVEFRDVEFSYQVTGVRDGFEKTETVIGVDALNKTTQARNDVQKKIDTLNKKIKEMGEPATEKK